ncbi:tetratricopeptide repeat protein [Roseimaritima multifibrata]|nr:hypothetical protein [Roseimaritima multifibrata]
MINRLHHCRVLGLVSLIACGFGLPANSLLNCSGQDGLKQLATDAEAQPAGPTKEVLIDTLNKVFGLLEQEDYVSASEYFVLPPNFRPEMLDGFIKRSEISQTGIDVLTKDAAFGNATQSFGAERAANHADRANVDITQCYGFYHTTDEATAEVMALWDGSRFKIMRLDDVGKLSATSAPAAASAKGELKALPKMASNLTEKDPAPVPAVDLAAIAQRLPDLEAATTANPLDAGARANFAMALYQIGNYPRAWTQLRVAVKVDPKHAGAAMGLAALFHKFESMGVFTVGVPPETVTGLLGEPDQIVDLGDDRKRYVYAFYAVDFQAGRIHETIDLRNATEAMFRPTEIVSVDLDGRGWRCGIRNKADGQVTARYYLPGEMISNWTEQVEVQRILGAANIGTSKEIAAKFVAQVKAAQPKMEHQILDVQDDSVIVALELPGSPQFAKRHQLVRLFRADNDVHRLAYSVKVDQPSEETQKKWLAIMKAAKLERVGE